MAGRWKERLITTAMVVDRQTSTVRGGMEAQTRGLGDERGETVKGVGIEIIYKIAIQHNLGREVAPASRPVFSGSTGTVR